MAYTFPKSPDIQDNVQRGVHQALLYHLLKCNMGKNIKISAR